MQKVIITGAGGRMGRRLIANLAASPDRFVLAGATERPGSSLLGADAGELAGVGKLGVEVVDSLESIIRGADVLIDFSTGKVTDNARLAAANSVAMVIGTTALTAPDREEIALLARNGARIVLSSNYSIGVNLLFHLAKVAADILPRDFDIEIVEAHHNQKKDAPSGTAVSLGEILCQARGLDYSRDVRHGREGLVGARTDHEIGMHSLRGGDIVGDHTVMFAAQGERLELTHRASSRDTFAKGALRAAAFLATAKSGLYDMQDVLGLR